MKRYLLAILVALLILPNACNDPATSVPTPTSGPDSLNKLEASQIFSYLNFALENMEVSDKFILAEHIHGPAYHVIGVSFPIEKKDGSTILTDVMTVPWTDITGFLNGTVSGFQLAAEVTPQPH